MTELIQIYRILRNNVLVSIKIYAGERHKKRNAVIKTIVYKRSFIS